MKIFDNSNYDNLHGGGDFSHAGRCKLWCLDIGKITLLTSPYNIFLNDSNGHGCYFKKYYYFNL
jgi:hypothetical protein